MNKYLIDIQGIGIKVLGQEGDNLLLGEYRS